MLCLGGLGAVAMQVRCVDSAREAARLAARGDEGAAAEAVRRTGPAGARLALHRDGEFVIARVSSQAARFLPVTVAAESVAMVEPGV
ncbi:hypothetical protein MMAD_49450 [Mycolicibacterium madagascariense]|uniref:Pilus biosynthesis protein TadE n=1 Tax=Mycolicibacterium madagascariense TaxID=212765 RepID=A0A7I7XN39_9MYCO|nr:TadE family type IV pilus minor pilin [Mycolicibacterium madagascariense]BBZ30650.1 hypothetical protein MMAD_49450 [Mycolicibacterium madagascariense]